MKMTNIAIEEKIDELYSILREGNVHKWLKVVNFADDLVNEAQRDWFTYYFFEEPPFVINFKILNKVIINDKAYVDCSLVLTYENNYKVKENHKYILKYLDSINSVGVIWFEKEREKFLSDHMFRYNFKRVSEIEKKDWWEKATHITCSDDYLETESKRVYARAITRNVRFREAHPQLESASLIANMMSINIIKFINDVYSPSKLETLSNIYNATVDTMDVKLTREDRDNGWASKFLVPWYGIDEIIEINHEGRISSSCFTFMSFIYSLLRLCGFSTEEVIQLRLINQDVIFVLVEKLPYLITADKIIELNDETKFYRRRITKIFTDKWYITDRGITNLTYENFLKIKEIVDKYLKKFEFPFQFKRGGFENIMGLNFTNNHGEKPIIENINIIKKILCNDINNRSDINIWSKYAYQLIYVKNPETYLLWSIQSKYTVKVIEEIYDRANFFKLVDDLEIKSIFTEQFRLMTAEQVLKYRKADYKSKVVLLYCWFHMKEKREILILYTTKDSYCVIDINSKPTIYSSTECGYVREIRGEILLAMNHKKSVYPLMSNGECKNIKFLEIINQFKGS